MDVTALVHIFIYLLIVGVVFGLLLYLIKILPIPEPYKGWLRIALIVVVVILIILFLLSLLPSVPALHIR